MLTNKKRGMLYGAFVVIFSLLLINTVNAATCSFNAPSGNGVNITTSPYTLNVTCTATNTDGAIYNVTFYYSSDGSTYTTIATVQNTTADQSIFTYSWDWSSIADGPYYLNATGYEYNVTDGSLLDTAKVQLSNIGLDDTAPSISKVDFSGRVSKGSTLKITITASDTGFTDGVQTCTINLMEENKVVTATDAGTDRFTYTFQPTIAGINPFKVTCTDYHGFSTTSKKYLFYVSSGSGSDTGSVPSGGILSGASQDSRIILLFLALVLGAVALFILVLINEGSGGSGRKSRRKRRRRSR